MKNGKTVILANGDFPHTTAALETLDHAARIIACDGAALTLLEYGRQPDAVIGDLDSLSENERSTLGELVIHVCEQDTNDLSKAFRHCIANGWKDITILGATGKREDHTLGNISLLADFALQAEDIEMITDYGRFKAIYHSATLPALIGQQISIFALEQNTPIESTGLKYPLNGLSPARWWQATLNQAISESFSLSFPEGKPVIIYWAETDFKH